MGGRKGAGNQLFVDGSFGSSLSDARPYADVRRPHQSMVLRTTGLSRRRTTISGAGVPQARQVLFTGGQSVRSISLNVEPVGTFSFPRTHELDVRAAKRVNLGGARSVELRFDIYNALNKGTITNRTLLSGANYLRPTAILFPRILQIGATFNFQLWKAQCQ
jgi:hypothetical protein